MGINKNSSGVVFDKSSHTYKLNAGGEIPGVTSVLKSAGLIDFSCVSPDFLAQASAFGTEVHEASNYFDKKSKPPENMSEACAEILCVYVDFLREFDVKILESEKMVYSTKYGYAGTLDRVAIFKKISDKNVIFDIKTGQESISHGIQIAAYERAFNKTREQMDTYTLYLRRDRFKLVHNQNQRQKFSIFLAALQIYNYKNNC